MIFFFTSDAFAQRIIWTSNGGGRLDSSFTTGVAFGASDTGLVTPYGVAVDRDSGRVYWTDVTTNQIWRSDLNGANKSPVLIHPDSLLELPRGIAIDEINRRMYWVENGSKKIRSANLDGSDPRDVLDSNLSAPTGIAVNAADGRIYWTDNGGKEKRIGMCGLDGSAPTIIDSTTLFVSGITVDTIDSKIFWTEYGSSNRIMSADLNGSGATVIDTLTSEAPRGIAVDPYTAKLYWTDYLSNQIQSSNLDGTGIDTLYTHLNNPLSIALVFPNKVTAVTAAPEQPRTFSLSQNYPNPFNPSTQIVINLNHAGVMSLTVYNVLGQLVDVVAQGYKPAGKHLYNVDMDRLASGVYFYTLCEGSNSITRKMLLLK